MTLIEETPTDCYSIPLLITDIIPIGVACAVFGLSIAFQLDANDNPSPASNLSFVNIAIRCSSKGIS